MTRGILIAGNESALFSAVAAEASKRVEEFACALIPNPFPRPEPAALRPETVKGKLSLQWSPGSPISARTLMLAAGNRLGQINNAVLICSPPGMFRPAETLVPGETESLINDQIKGWFFLVRELALVFRAQNGGTLALVVPDVLPGGGKDIPADLLGPPAAASFKALAQGLLASAANEPFEILGFTTAEAGSESGFAEWFFKIIDEGGRKNSGKWFKYSRLSLFR
jgi:hypothetical protein